MAELKPCPFCGDKVTIIRREKNFQTRIEKTNGLCRCGFVFTIFSEINKFEEKWNRRADNG